MNAVVEYLHNLQITLLLNEASTKNSSTSNTGGIGIIHFCSRKSHIDRIRGEDTNRFFVFLYHRDIFNMNDFLRSARKRLETQGTIVIVIGNESCDLDSSVCANALAYFYQYSGTSPHNINGGGVHFIPVLNICRENLPLKTEVTYFMKKQNIDIESLICSNEVPQNVYEIAKFILVDHHVPNNPVISAAQIIEVIDHRPLTSNAISSADCIINMKMVGSCATLVADVIRTSETSSSLSQYSDVLRLLHGAILLDTLNFSSSADKARPLDIEVFAEIERVISIDQNERDQLFRDLVEARRNVACLNAYQLLSKDLKVVSNKDDSTVVPICGFPMLVEKYIEKNDAYAAIKKFAESHKCDVVVLMGMMEVDVDSIRRDLAVISLSGGNLGKKIVETLSHCKDPDLMLQEVASTRSFNGMVHYEQRNVKASRKQILPMVQDVLNKYISGANV